MRYRTAIVLLAAIALVVVVTLGRVNVAFESTKGDWADHEVLSKGRKYEFIARLFQRYKVACGWVDATLVRTTLQNPYNVFAWYSYATDEKWNVPYQPPRHFGVVSPSCANGADPNLP